MSQTQKNTFEDKGIKSVILTSFVFFETSTNSWRGSASPIKGSLDPLIDRISILFFEIPLMPINSTLLNWKLLQRCDFVGGDAWSIRLSLRKCLACLNPNQPKKGSSLDRSFNDRKVNDFLEVICLRWI